MSDEVKEAADRLRRLDAAEGGSVVYGSRERDVCHRRFNEDCELLADSYLLEHANDEENATLLTAEILQASGWVPSVAGTIWDHQMTRMQLRVDVNNWHVSVCGVRIGTVETVGDLRKLLEALHVPAVVVVPKGGE